VVVIVVDPNQTRKLLGIAVQIADGLAAAHAAGIIHRDLKHAPMLMRKQLGVAKTRWRRREGGLNVDAETWMHFMAPKTERVVAGVVRSPALWTLLEAIGTKSRKVFVARLPGGNTFGMGARRTGRLAPATWSWHLTCAVRCLLNQVRCQSSQLVVERILAFTCQLSRQRG
jgi:hypothetical protein